MRYLSKPSEIEAIQWTGDNFADLGDALDREPGLRGPEKVRLHATAPERDQMLELLAGKDGAQEWVPVPVGHWLVHQPGDLTDIWPVDPDDFAAKYDPA